MKNKINEDINRTLYLFNYKPGRVISEQEHPELDETRGYKRKYDDDEIKQVASNYETVPKFKEENPTIFSSAVNRKMLDDLFPNRKKHKKLTDDEVRIEASKHKTVKDFQEKSPIIFSTARNRKMLDDLFPDRQLGSGRAPKYSEDYIRKEASKHKTVKDFMDKNYKVYQIAYKRKMIDDLFPDRKKNILHTDDDIRREASKHKTVKDFQEKSPKVYQVAYKRKMLDDLFPDRQLGGGRAPKYSEDYIRKEASKHKTDKDFKVKNYKVWQIAYKRGMIDDLFPNRKTGSGRSKLIREPEETQSNLSNKVSDYWSSPTSTLDFNSEYNYKVK